MTTRRSFIGGLLAITSGGAAAEAARQELPDDVARLVALFGEDAILRRLQELLAAGEEITFQSLRRSLQRDRRRERRRVEAAQRRERHAGSTVIYRGPVLVDDLDWLWSCCQYGTSRVSRHAVLIGSTTPESWLGQQQIGVVHVVIDNRRGLQSPCMGELVETHKDRYPVRLHLWQPSTWSAEYAARRAVTLRG